MERYGSAPLTEKVRIKNFGIPADLEWSLVEAMELFSVKLTDRKVARILELHLACDDDYREISRSGRSPTRDKVLWPKLNGGAKEKKMFSELLRLTGTTKLWETISQGDGAFEVETVAVGGELRNVSFSSNLFLGRWREQFVSVFWEAERQWKGIAQAESFNNR